MLARIFRAFAQERRHRVAIRHRISGELVAQIGQRELKALGEFFGVRDRFRQIGKELGHFRWRLQISLRILRQQFSRKVHPCVIADAGENIEDLALFGSRVAWSIGCEQRQRIAARQCDHCLIARFLLAVKMPLYLYI